jgi:hypothetical protein
VREKRKKIWIDRFQTYLSVRLAVYFLLYQVAVWALFWIDARMTTLGDATGLIPSYGFVLTPVVAVGLGMLFIYDAVKLTHRIVGPLYRFRVTVRAITAGEEVRIVGLREGDHLQELKDDLNEMLRALEQRGVITIKAAAGDPARVPVAV